MSSARRAAGRWSRRVGAVALLAAAGSLLALPRVQPARAQPAAAESAGGGWLGVGLISFSECLEGPAAPDDECRHTLVVGGLVHGGPADRAGLQPGDTLVSVDGTPLADGLEDGVFRRMAPGDTVSIVVGRAAGRVRLEAVPGSRPDSLAIVRYLRNGARADGRSRYLLAIPEPVVLDSLVSTSAPHASFDVRTRISVVPTERVKRIPLRPDPGARTGLEASLEARERLAEMRARARRLQREAIERTWDFRREMAEPPRTDDPAGEEWKRWVAEELQPRLQVIYDSVLAEARHRMDSLRSFYPAIAAEAAESLDGDYSRLAERLAGELDSSSPPAPPRAPEAERPGLPPSPEELGMPGNRIAGAELQPLNPQLAEFFGDAERGLVVLQVLSGTPASRLGLRPGDVIVEAAGRPLTGLVGLRHALMERAAVEIRWVRRGQTMVDTLRH